jgi:hypothetical protein
MSLEQYKDASRKELWEILKIQVELVKKLGAKLQNTQSDKIAAISKERKRWGREDLEALAIRDLEQQAKGIELFVKSEAENLQKAPWFKDSQPTLEYLYDADFGLSTCSSAVDFSNQLRNQAKELKKIS